jgi:hypothetical protein
MRVFFVRTGIGLAVGSIVFRAHEPMGALTILAALIVCVPVFLMVLGKPLRMIFMIWAMCISTLLLWGGGAFFLAQYQTPRRSEQNIAPAPHAQPLEDRSNHQCKQTITKVVAVSVSLQTRPMTAWL